MTSRFWLELVPILSQLLREYLLVSFPPDYDMLKSSGFSYFTQGISESTHTTAQLDLLDLHHRNIDPIDLARRKQHNLIFWDLIATTLTR
jgi:hypothetical protein